MRREKSFRENRFSKRKRPATKGRPHAKVRPRSRTGSDETKTVRPRIRTGSDKTKVVRPRIRRGPWSDAAYSVTPSPKAEAPAARPGVATENKPERLQKVLARAGVASRRNAELLILEGAVSVNGRIVAELGTKVDPVHDKIKVQGRLIYTEVEPIYVALYKPKGVISALTDPEGRQTVGNLVRAIRERVLPIGRMDYNSEGLLLLTNDGELAEKIIKARNLPRVYMVKVKGHPSEEDLDFLKRGFFTADGVVRFASFGVEQSLRNKSWLKLEVSQGSQLDLRELLNRKGLLVDRIVRTAIGPISVKGLEPGQYRFLKRRNFEELLEARASLNR